MGSGMQWSPGVEQGPGGLTLVVCAGLYWAQWVFTAVGLGERC